MNEEIDGVKVVRKGNRLTTILHAFIYYLKNRRKFDLVIDNFHAFSFLTNFYVAKKKRMTMIYEVAGREIWFHMTSFPINIIGRLLERIGFSIFLRNEKFIAISDSTKQDLLDHGIKDTNVSIIPMGINQKVLEKLPQKTETPTLVYFGGIRKMKRIEEQIEAIALLKENFPDIVLFILGRKKGKYYRFLTERVYELGLEKHVEFVGFLTEAERNKLVESSWINLGTSVKEGWSLVVNEANALGTPTVAYDVHGYKDSVGHYENGLLTIENTPESLAQGIKRLLLDNDLYKKLQMGGFEITSGMNFDRSAEEFERIVWASLFSIEPVTQVYEDLVSIIIPTLNPGKDFEECLKSVSSQTYENIEVIVVDGGSKDNTIQIAKKYGVNVIKSGKGRSLQKNLGAKRAKGKYLYFIDADFVLDSGIIESAVSEIEEKNLDMIAVHNVSDPSVSFWSKVRRFERDLFKYDRHNISPRFLTKKAFEKVNGFNERLIAAEDYDIYNRLLRKGYKLGFIEEDEIHLGEPKSLTEIIKKHFFYGSSIKGLFGEGKERPVLTFAQKFPIRPAYIKKFYRFLFSPVMTVGFMIYQVARFGAGGVGYIYSRIFGKRGQEVDRVFTGVKVQ
ncbi:MAG TPA: glycosyltransferase [bacterium]|nr:glycosyltransferase [bacterium]